MVAEQNKSSNLIVFSCSLAKISMVAEHNLISRGVYASCSLAKISMVAELVLSHLLSI